LLPVETLSFLIGADLKHAMTKRSKHAFASADVARSFQEKHGGTLAKFDDALRESYLDMASDVTMIRKMREERRRRAAEAKKA
jgi:nitrous oxide reductase accessory protein NosL